LAAKTNNDPHIFRTAPRITVCTPFATAAVISSDPTQQEN